MDNILKLETAIINLEKIVLIIEISNEKDNKKSVEIFSTDGLRQTVELPDGKSLKDFT